MQRNRTELKVYFQKGKIPTQSNFEELIDSVVVQGEDNLVKPANDPLTLRAVGPEERVLLFARVEGATDRLTWQMTQKPAGAPKPGLSIGDAVASRLFIQSETGNVGIGTTNPGGALHVSALNDALVIQPEKMGGGQKTRIRFSDPDNGTGPMAIEFRDTGTPALYLTGGQWVLDGGDLSLNNPSAINFGTNTRQMINLWSKEYAIGVQGGTQYYRTSGHYAWFLGGAHSDATFDAGTGGQALMVLLNSGTLGVGTSGPQGRIDAEGVLRIGLNANGAGRRNISFYRDPTDEVNAGKISYKPDWDTNALAIVGAGAGSSRKVRIWDDVYITGTLNVGGDIAAGGNVGVRGYSAKARTPGWGGGIHTWDVEAEATIWARNAIQTGARDLAENHRSDHALQAGEVVCLDRVEDRIVRSDGRNTDLLIGVISRQPGVLLGVTEKPSESNAPADLFPVALTGCVPCKVTDENGSIARGDLLTPSSTPGYAMKAKPTLLEGIDYYKPGTILGKALAAHLEGQGEIEVFVTLR